MKIKKEISLLYTSNIKVNSLSIVSVSTLTVQLDFLLVNTFPYFSQNDTHDLESIACFF